jgi:hypothetical protein
MSLRKRLKVLYAALTQHWFMFTCGCGKDVWVSDGAGTLLDGLMCDECEAKAHDAWFNRERARFGHSKGAA